MWQVWDDGFKPLFEGTEQEVKDYVLDHMPRKASVYIQSPEGDEYVYDQIRGKWMIEAS
jgi:hypothetical protein